MAKKDQLRYAKDVLLAYDHWKRDFPSDLIAENPSAEAIHEYAHDPKNYKEFLGMVKAATDQLQKANKDVTPDEMLKVERRSIQELKDILSAAVEEAKSVC